ncbi:MAG: hypothetical protein JSS76_11155 [Bacteroidetes bacterium]|nr:hypothetical protein [Bacteroidota bacterium]
MLRIAHIVNPVKAPEGSELTIVQPITFESIRIARSFATDISVELFTASYPEDHSIIPSYFHKTPDLERSIRDIPAFAGKKKLPFIKDILQRLYSSTDAEWLIYTNADIALMPQFYATVAQLIAAGYDAIVINRRRISRAYHSVSELPLMYSDIGASHPGYDCFVFHRDLLAHFSLEGICIGVPFIEVSLLHNIITRATSLKHIDDMHLTFHIGMEVMPPVDRDLYRHNRATYEQNIRPLLKPDFDSSKFPYQHLALPARMIRYALNPCYSTALMLELEGKTFMRKIKILLDEMRWRILAR